jgi:hypothetical protein
MRKLFSIGALVAASLVTVWQPAIADQPATVVPAAYYYHGRYYPHRHWQRGYWHHGHHYNGYYRYYR